MQNELLFSLGIGQNLLYFILFIEDFNMEKAQVGRRHFFSAFLTCPFLEMSRFYMQLHYADGSQSNHHGSQRTSKSQGTEDKQINLTNALKQGTTRRATNELKQRTPRTRKCRVNAQLKLVARQWVRCC